MLSRPDYMYKQFLFVFTSRGERFSFKNSNLVIWDSEGGMKHQSTCYRLSVLFIVGHASISTGLIERSKRYQFSIILLNHNLRPYSILSSATEGNFLLRRKQYAYSELGIAKHILINKLESQYLTLSKIRVKNPKRMKVITKLKNDVQRLEQSNPDLQELLSTEGQAAKAYFSTVFPEELWTGRKPRSKCNPINTLLDIGYTMLFNLVESLLNLYGFDIYVGVYHQCFYQRKSLVCDIMEPARPIIDYRIRKAYRLGQIHEEDFDIRQGQYLLLGKKAAPYTAWLLEVILDNKEALFVYVQLYYRAFMRGKSPEEFPKFKFNSTS